MGVAVGVVPLEARGTLPLAELHGEPMFLHPVRALLRCGGLDRVVVTADDPSAATPYLPRRLHVDALTAEILAIMAEHDGDKAGAVEDEREQG